MSTTIYLVGTKESLKTNSWSAMTNDLSEVERLFVELNCDTMKEVEVKPPRGKK